MCYARSRFSSLKFSHSSFLFFLKKKTHNKIAFKTPIKTSSCFPGCISSRLTPHRGEYNSHPASASTVPAPTDEVVLDVVLMDVVLMDDSLVLLLVHSLTHLMKRTKSKLLKGQYGPGHFNIMMMSFP